MTLAMKLAPTFVFCFSLFLLLWECGCRPQEKIDTYQVDKTPLPAKVDPELLKSQLDHMLAAIVPQGSKAWFFKLVGSQSAIDRERENYLQFLGSLKLNADKNPSWKVPEGWKEKPGSGLRAASFLIGDQTQPLELTVTSLDMPAATNEGVWKAYVTNNINRWLRQLQQGPLETAEIFSLLKSIPVEAAASQSTGQKSQANWIELVGIMAQKPATGAMPAGHPPVASQATPPQPPAKNTTPSEPTSSPFTYNKPDHWQSGRVGGMRKAAFRITDGDSQAELTVIDLSTRAASITDLAANLRRWAAGVNRQDWSDQQLAELVVPVEIDGIQGNQALLLGPQGEDSSQAEKKAVGTLAAMIQRGNKVWFFKLHGDQTLVVSEQEAFAEFLKSVKFK